MEVHSGIADEPCSSTRHPMDWQEVGVQNNRQSATLSSLVSSESSPKQCEGVDFRKKSKIKDIFRSHMNPSPVHFVPTNQSLKKPESQP